MTKRGSLLIAVALSLAASVGCNNGSATPVAPSPDGYAGEWSGATSQGKPFSLSVSADQKVTSLVFGYTAGSCSDTKTVSNLSLPIVDPKAPPITPLPIPLPTPQSPFNNPGFYYATITPDGLNYEQVTGAFTSSATLTGELILSYSGCGTGIGTAAIFNAAKH